MGGFGKRNFTIPVARNHQNRLDIDWYVSFRFKHEGKIHHYKRREGINRIKQFEKRIEALRQLVEEIEIDLKNGWNPIIDPKRENLYNIDLKPKKLIERTINRGKVITKKELKEYLLNK